MDYPLVVVLSLKELRWKNSSNNRHGVFGIHGLQPPRVCRNSNGQTSEGFNQEIKVLIDFHVLNSRSHFDPVKKAGEIDN